MVSAHQSQHTLVVNSGPNTGQAYILQDMVSTLGRSADNTIVLDSTRVSRYHAKITILPTGAVIEDTGSTNGTFVNGQQVTAQYPLASGDMVGIADYIMFQYIVEEIMGSSLDAPPPMSGSSTQIMNGPGALGPSQMPVVTPQYQSYAAEYQPSTFSPTTPTPSSPAISPSVVKNRPTYLYVVIAILVILICLCVALAVYLWFAPETFWRDLFDFFGLPWPSSQNLIQYF